MDLALFVLMVIIGLNIGTSPEVMDNLGRIGLNCVLISFFGIACSVALVRACEATIMPLEEIRLELALDTKRTVMDQMIFLANLRGMKKADAKTNAMKCLTKLQKH